MKTATRKAALLVIDVQESFRKRPYWQPQDAGGFLANVQALVDNCRQEGIPVIQIFHQEPWEDPQNPFHPQSGFVRPMGELKLEADAVFFKEVHSALYARTTSGTTLESWLRSHASDAGFKVQFVSDATLTFPMQSRAGRHFSPAEIRERTELVLDGRFARVVSTAEILE
jgi:nicotinamidase-related amidase